MFIAYGVACGLIELAERALVAHLVGSERKGLAYGWFNFAIGIFTLPSSLIFGALYQYQEPGVAFAWGTTMAIVSSLLLLGVGTRPLEKRHDDPSFGK